MHMKYSIQGLLIYLSIAGYILAFLTTIIRLRKTSHFLFFAGFIASLASYGYHWYLAKYFPLQNLFEFFLFLACFIYPLSLFSKKVLKTPASTFDSLIGAVSLIPAGFVFSDTVQFLPPALQNPFFVPQVAIFLIAYTFMTKAAIAAFAVLIGIKNHQANLVDLEEAEFRLVCAGFPLLTAGLVLGCLLSQFAWADWWAWNPEQMWSLATWLVFAGYFFYRAAFGSKFSRLNSLWILTAFAMIIITLFWANLSRLFVAPGSYA